MSITYTIEQWDKYSTEMQAVLESTHAPEAAAFQDKMSVGLNEAYYKWFDTQSTLHSVIVRDNTNLIGYHITVLLPNMHFKTLDKSRHIRTGQVIQYFIDKNYRGKGIGSTMFRLAEAGLKALGVELVASEAKSNLPYARLFRHLEWFEAGTIFQKWLGE